MRRIKLKSDFEKLEKLSNFLLEFDWDSEKYKDGIIDDYFWRYIEFFKNLNLEKETYPLQINFERRFLPEISTERIRKEIYTLNRKVRELKLVISK